MRKRFAGLGLLALIAAVAVPARAEARDIDFAPLIRAFAPPSAGNDQGWLAVSNRDWKPYTVVIQKKGRASLYEGAQSYPGMQCIVIPSGATTTLALEKDTWEFQGNNDDELKVKVREGRTSTLSLEPFGPRGATGLRGITNDGDRVRTEVLFDNYYAPPVIVQPPTIIEVPPPPPVIVMRPPVVVHRPPSFGHGGHRPPPPPHRRPGPHRGRDRDKGGLSLLFDFFD